MAVKTPKKRINVTLPASLLEELKTYVSPRERNKFIVEAIENHLQKIRFKKALKKSAGAWSDEDHPDLMTVEDVNNYVRKLREASMPRSWDEIAAEAEQDD